MAQLSILLLTGFILNLGVAFGAGLYETRIVLPRWFHTSAGGLYRVSQEDMRNLDTGRKFWGFVTTIPLTLLTVANLYAAWESPEPAYSWWLGASVCALAERLGTFAFFIPTAIRLQKADQLPEATVSRLITNWIRLNYLRNMLTLISWLLAMRAFALVA